MKKKQTETVADMTLGQVKSSTFGVLKRLGYGVSDIDELLSKCFEIVKKNADELRSEIDRGELKNKPILRDGAITLVFMLVLIRLIEMFEESEESET